jgi:hypothetical protein
MPLSEQFVERVSLGYCISWCRRFHIRALFAFVVASAALGLVAEALAVNFTTLQVISDGDPTNDDNGRANTDINSVAIKVNSLVTIGNYQFTSYYDASGKIIVGRRTIGADTWSLLRTQFTADNINDDHDVSSIGIDGDGILHMSWGMHDNNFLYTHSTASVLNSNPMNLIGASVGNSAAINNMTGLYNTSVTYPVFYNLPDGDLLFQYRNGVSGAGDYRLRRYDTATDTWSELGAGPNQIWLGSQAPGSNLPDVNAYPNQFAFDSQGNIHATWTWRGSGATYQTNHNIMYARSPDGGATWTTMNGTPYNGPIYETNAEVALNIPQNNSLINTTGMAIDKFDEPVVASWWAPGAAQGDNRRQYMLAWYDKNQQQWRTSQITHRTIDSPSAMPETVRDLGRPIVVVDDSNRVIVAMRQNEGSNGLTIAYSESPNRNDWQFVGLSTQNLGDLEPTYDINRWNRDRVLSLIYQPSNLGQSSAPISVLEWDSNKFFADLHAPKLTLFVNRETGAVSMQNGTGALVAIDGYSIGSPSGSLSVSGWHSLQDQGVSQWQEANPTSTKLNELNPTGSLTLNNSAQLQLGSAFHFSATNLAQALKQSDVTFEYTTPTGDVRNGAVQYSGVGNLEIIVDPVTGNAILKNASQFNVGLEAYTISSSEGSLLFQNGNWASLADQGAGGGDWQEANVNANRLSELKFSGNYQFAKGAQISLGHMFNASGSRDLEFQFLLAEGDDVLDGVVVYQISGDFNSDGSVDMRDYIDWRDGLGTTYTQSDFNDWRSHFGESISSGLGASSNSAVPEPAAPSLFVVGMLATYSRRITAVRQSAG